MKILELCEPIRGLGILNEKRCLDDEILILKSWLVVRKHEIGKTSIRKWWIKLRERCRFQLLEREVDELNGEGDESGETDGLAVAANY